MPSVAGAHGEPVVISAERVEHKQEQDRKLWQLHAVDPVLTISQRLVCVTETVARTGGPRTAVGVHVGRVIEARAVRQVCVCKKGY